jgi:tetratricopeptide (TPR) repeat protein
LVQHPQAGANDFIGMIRLSQSLGETSKARLHLDALLADPALLATIENVTAVDRITAIQAYLEESYEDGLTGMQEFVHNPDADTAMVQEAFRAILQIDLPLEVESELLELYLELPVQDVTMSLGVLNRLVQLQPLQEEEWIHYAIAQLLERDVLSVGSWLSEIEASESVISELREIESSKLSGEQALVLVNAYIVEKDSENAQTSLNQSKSVLDPVSSAFLQSQIFAQQDRIDEAIEFWKEAYQGVVGTNRFPLMKNLGLLALQLDQPVNAMQSLYTAFSAGIPFNEIQAGKLIGLTMEYGSLRQAIQVADYLAGRFSDSPVHQNNLAYFRFLAEEQVEESVEVMRGLVEEYSEIPQFRLTLALGLVKSGRSNEANRLLKSTNINWQETSTRGLLIYCVVLAASDQQTLAQGLLQSLDTEVLIPEEKALLESF